MTSQNIYSLRTPAKGILSDPPPPPPLTHQIQPPPPSSYCWRYSRWPCHSRPCVPSGILSCPQPAAPRSVQLLTIYLHSRSALQMLRGASKNTRGRFTQTHTLRTVGGGVVGGGSVSPNIHAIYVKLSSQQLSVPIGSSYGSPYMPPLPAPQSWRQQLMLRIVHKV